MLGIHLANIGHIMLHTNTLPHDPAIIGGYSIDYVRRRTFELCYTQHGGGGLGLAFADVESMDGQEADWMLDELMARRKAEASAIKNA